MIDVEALPSESFARFELSASSAGRTEPSVLLNRLPPHALEKIEASHPESREYLVWLREPVVTGRLSIVSLESGAFAPSTLESDFAHPERLHRPQEMPRLAGTALCIAYRHAANYFHWTYQSFAGLLDMQAAGLSTDRILSNPINAWQRRSLELAGVDPQRCFELAPEASVRVERLLYSAFVSRRSVNRPTARHIGLFEALADRVCGARRESGSGERIYVCRLNAKRRRIENEAEICALVERYGFEVVDTEGMTVDDQIRLFASARHVVAPHGAGLVNLLYARRCDSVTELLQAGNYNQCMFRICQAKGIAHYSLQADCVRPGTSEEDWRVVSRVDPELLERHLQRLVPRALHGPDRSAAA